MSAADRVLPRPRALALAPAMAGPGWLYAFVIVQMLAQVCLVFLDVGGLRTVFRIGVFALSLAFLALLPGAALRHPAVPAVVAVLGIYGVQLFHPTTNTWLSGAAQLGLTLSILAPLLWVTRLRLDASTLRRVMLLFWVFHATSAVVGVLQVYFPGQFQPKVSAVIVERGDDYVDSLQIELESGEQVFRPMGLTDIPGGAASSGFYTVLLGVGMLLAARTGPARAAFGASMAAGMAAIYLSQVRVMLVVLIVCLCGAAAMLLIRGLLRRLTSVVVALSVVALLGLWISFGAAKTAVTRRLDTLLADRPGAVYYENRGHFLESTLTEFVPRFPFGAGLGRWGMMNHYFGSSGDPASSALWAEIQWTGWIFDGGIPLALAYALALGLTLLFAVRVALRRPTERDDVWLWATILAGYNLGTIAMTFSYPVFVSQTGMEFWLLNALLFATAVHKPGHPRPASGSPPSPHRVRAPLPAWPRR